MASLIRTQLEANALLRQHGLMDAGWTFKWDAAKKRGGSCNYTARQVTMSKHLVPLWTEEQVMQTLLHEVAHALAGYEAHHGPAWQRIARSLGHSGARTHNNAVVPAPWEQRCPNHGILGHVHRRKNNLICLRCKADGIHARIFYTARVDSYTARVDNSPRVR